ncbi:MAG: AAA family ATPase [Candidatus Omnitrophota bacterium]
MSLSEVRYQDYAVDFLRKAVRDERIAHAYLFLGPKGSGKKKVAYEFVKLINCDNRKEDICSKCPSCIKTNNLSHPDIFFISKGEEDAQISVSVIRQVRRFVSFKPYEAKWKVVIIDDADFLNEESSNALLKILEEPSEYSVFVLMGQRRGSFSETIISRCQIVKFRPFLRGEVASILIDKFEVDKEEANFLSFVSNGDLKRSLYLREKQGLCWRDKFISSFAADENNFGCENDFASLDKDFQTELLNIIQGFFRDISIYKVTGDKGLIINIDKEDQLRDFSNRLSHKIVEEAVTLIEETKVALLSNANSKISVRVLIERLMELCNSR